MVKQSNALWEATARQAADPDFGLHFGEAAADLGGGHMLFRKKGKVTTHETENGTTD